MSKIGIELKWLKHKKLFTLNKFHALKDACPHTCMYAIGR